MSETYFGLANKSLLEGGMQWLEGRGVSVPRDRIAAGALRAELVDEEFDLAIARPSMMPDLVAEGDVGMAISCTDGVIESGLERRLNIISRLDFGICRLALMVPKEADVKGPNDLQGCRIATSYPTMLERWLEETGLKMDIEVQPGSMELMPYRSTRPTDAIADLVESGRTRDANALREVGTIATVQAVLIESRLRSPKSAFTKLTAGKPLSTPKVLYNQD